MAIIFAPQGNAQYSGLGAALGSGLNQGVGAYIQHKQQQRKLADRMKGLQGMGFSPQESQALAGMPDNVIMQFMKEKQSGREREALGGLRGQLFGGMGGQPQQGMDQMQPQGNVVGGLAQGLDRPPAQEQQEPGSISERLMGLNSAGINPRDYDKLFQEATALDNLALKKEANKTRDEAGDRKIESKRVDEIGRRAEKTDRRIADYEQLKDLATSGQLHSGSLRKLADTIGFPKTWQGSASEVGTKLLANLNFERMLSSVPGGRSTAKLLEEIQKTNPNIYQEPKSIAVLSQLMINQEREDQLLNDEVQKLKAANKNITPLGVVDKAQKNIKPKVKELHEDSKELIDKAYGLKPAKKESIKVGSKVAELSGVPQGTLVRNKAGEYLILEANGKGRKATQQELVKYGVQ